jgi:hypothetical protein
VTGLAVALGLAVIVGLGGLVLTRRLRPRQAAIETATGRDAPSAAAAAPMEPARGPR